MALTLMPLTARVPIAHNPHVHVSGLRSKTDEIPEVVVGGLALGHLGLGFGFDGVDNIGELDGILDKEDGNVVANQIPIAFAGIEFDGKPSNVADGIGRTS